MRCSTTIQILTLSLIFATTKALHEESEPDDDLTSHITTEKLIEMFGINPNQTSVVIENEMDVFTVLGHDIESFIQELLSFVSEHTFANEKFDVIAEDLGQQLLTFVNSMNPDSNPPSEEIWQKFTFANYAFQTMAESSEIMRRYNYLGSQEEHLINCMGELRVRLLIFFDTNGFPNVKDKTLDFKRKQYAVITSFLTEMFDQIPSVPIGTRLAFTTQTEEVREILHRLEPKVNISQPKGHENVHSDRFD